MKEELALQLHSAIDRWKLDVEGFINNWESYLSFRCEHKNQLPRKKGKAYILRNEYGEIICITAGYPTIERKLADTTASKSKLKKEDK